MPFSKQKPYAINTAHCLAGGELYGIDVHEEVHGHWQVHSYHVSSSPAVVDYIIMPTYLARTHDSRSMGSGQGWVSETGVLFPRLIDGVQPQKEHSG